MKWYNNNLKLILAILFIAPLGIYGLYKKKTNKNALKNISLVLGSIYSVFYIILLISLVAFLFTDKDKLNYDTAITKMKDKKFDEALAEFKEIENDSEYFSSAQKQITLLNQKLDSIKNSKLEILANIDNQRKKIEDQRIIWSDSIVKSWKGEFILDYKKPIIGDTIYFMLSKNASKTFQSNRDLNLPLYHRSYKNHMKNNIGPSYSDNVVIDFIQDLEVKSELAIQNMRREKIMQQFGFNGQHRKLERAIKNSMNDPDSYEHVSTSWKDKGDYIQLEATVRGTNAYGAKILKTYYAKALIDGEIIDIK